MTRQNTPLSRSLLLLFLFVFGLLGIIASGGGGGGGPTPTGGDPSAAAKTSTLPPGDPDCPDGGILVETGIDDNGNGSLEPDEIDQTGYVCEGGDGRIGWGEASALDFDSDDFGNADAPQIAMNAAGDAVAVWEQYDGSRTNAWANRYTAGKGWGVPQLIETDNAGDASSPQITLDGDGNALALWLQDDGARDNVWANRYVVR